MGARVWVGRRRGPSSRAGQDVERSRPTHPSRRWTGAAQERRCGGPASGALPAGPGCVPASSAGQSCSRRSGWPAHRSPDRRPLHSDTGPKAQGHSLTTTEARRWKRVRWAKTACRVAACRVTLLPGRLHCGGNPLGRLTLLNFRELSTKGVLHHHAAPALGLHLLRDLQGREGARAGTRRRWSMCPSCKPSCRQDSRPGGRAAHASMLQ